MSKAELIPREILFGNPEKITVRLSRNGQYISYLAPSNGSLNIWVAPSDDLSKAKVITNDKRGIRSYVWAFNNTHIIYAQDGDGDENWRLYAVNINDHTEKLLTPKSKVRATISELSSESPDEILVSHNERNPEYFDIYKINILTGESKMWFQNEGKYISFFTDEKFNVLLAAKMLPDGMYEIYKICGENSAKLIDAINEEDMLTSYWSHIVRGGEYAYVVDSRGSDVGSLYKVNLDNGKREKIFTPTNGEISDYITDPHSFEIQAVAEEYMRAELHVIDNSIKQEIEAIKNIDEGDFNIVSRTANGDKWIIAFSISDGPVKYYLCDRSGSKPKIDFLLNSNPKQAKYQFAKMHPVKIKTSDGLDMVSYLTLPSEVNYCAGKVDKKVPLILLVHGGPNARDAWGFSPMVQWLANRGYGVLQVNYRGSTGFGKKFVNAGDGEWAGKMQRDLEEAAKWAIDQSIVDQDQIAIMGGSYGGYATLVGMTMTPEKYALGVDIVGISNLETFKDSIPPYWKPARAHLNKMMGVDVDSQDSVSFLRKRSPVNYVQNVTKPLMIIQGANDPRVNVNESEQMVAALQKNNIPVSYLLYPDEGHGLSRPENKLSMYGHIELFLAKFLGGRLEAVEHVEGSTVQVKAESSAASKR